MTAYKYMMRYYTVADPANCILGGANFEIFSVGGGGEMRFQKLEIAFQ